MCNGLKGSFDLEDFRIIFNDGFPFHFEKLVKKANTKKVKKKLPKKDRVKKVICPFYIVVRGGLYGVRNTNGDIIIPAMYDSLKIEPNLVIGYINFEGKTIKEDKYNINF
jgi:hypothetical protein